MAGLSMSAAMIDKRCSDLAKTLRSKNVSEEDIALRISRYKKFAADYLKKSGAIAENDSKTSISSRTPPQTHSSVSTKKVTRTKPESGDQVNEKTSVCPKSPVKEAQNSSLRADGDSGISSERKSPVGLISRGLSNDSATGDSAHPRKSTSDQPHATASSASKNETVRRQSRTAESTRPSKKRSSASSSSRSASVSRSCSRSRSRSDVRSRSKRKGHKKHKKNKKRRKHHRRHKRRSHSARSPSYSRYRSRSRSRSRRGRRRHQKHSRSRSSSVYSSLSRSPSIRRRPGSPSHLDRRRITRYAVRTPPRSGNHNYGTRYDRSAFTSSLGPRISGLSWYSQLRR